MSNVTLVSNEYAESVFVTGPEFIEALSKKQDDVGLYINHGDGSVMIDKGITQNGMVYENYFEGFTRFESVKIGTAELGDTEINGQKPVLNIASQDGSVTVTQSADGYDVDLKVNGGSSKWITDGTDGGKTYLSLGRDENRITVNSVFVAGSLYDKDGKEITGGSSFNYISEGDDAWPASLSLGAGPNGTVNSIFICGPLYGCDGSIFVEGPTFFRGGAYDKDGKEIKGGGSTGGSKWISDDTQGGKTILNLGHGSAGTVNSIFVCGPVKMHHGEDSWYGTTTIGMQETMIGGGMAGFGIKYEGDNGTKTGIWIGSDTLWDNAVIQIDMYKYDGTRSAELFLDGDKLNKLSSLIDNADALLALLKN